ncbi:uncharacterized protein LOC129574754 [Sitodiplosis mosellana]|uniref:uncharacterized protein LOC129574754 n=1 Tax=Sitodiplosis mosellana TaxID=263140 RepID=UPI0024444514|nr:uncharacterized protein LOC129574754 [Sitodiplosis mosellana]XP_055313171.1 uncharacterized protein LOC129574754 [Sitodiplosis mosellana]XP_055313180.1 uncharacterized protein LOC129574754 [Sitodiplosis mosellana]
MAIDYIIGALQLLSTAVNVLALGSFWITPGLRTTANRFVINLLIVNIVGCLALTPALWLHGGLIRTVYSETHQVHDNAEAFTRPATPLSTLQNHIELIATVKPSTFVKIFATERIFDDNYDEEIFADIREDTIQPNRTTHNKTAATNETWSPTKNIQYSDCTRFWGFDLVAALGGLSVMLVVGDTWCAVTDPLRYHSRISGLKSWVLIVATWFVSILFCIASALRRDCRMITTEITSTLQKITSSSSESDVPSPTSSSSSSSLSSTSMVGDSLGFDDIYNLIYSCTFFVVIILLPICLVCAMYWKIYSEARQNGLRMRQNGSSPLLQSALNLATASAHLPPPTHLDHSCSVIGEEDSDNATDSLASSRSNVIQITLRRNSMAATTSPVHHVSIKDPHCRTAITPTRLHSSVHKVNSQPSPIHRRYLEIPKFNEIQNYRTHIDESKNQMTELNGPIDASSDESSSGVDKRRHLLFEHRLVYDPLTADVANELRQVHSTPDLQKSIQTELSLLAASHRNAKHSSDKKIHSSGSINKHACTATPTRRPSICTPPKALSYMTSIRHRLSNASSIFKYREESRAARISILVVIMFLFSYFPYGLLVLLQGRATFFANSSCFGVLFLLIANISSPFIFAYRNRRVRRGVCRLFGVDAKTNERLQKQRMIMHGNLRANSCRERKRKTKVVRINRNSTKSASFSSGSIDQPKYTPVPLIEPNETTETSNQKYNKPKESTVCIDGENENDSTNGVAPMDAECRIDMPHTNVDDEHETNGCVPSHVINFISNCTNNSSNCKRDQSDSMDDAAVAKYVKDIVNNINCANNGNKNANHQLNRIPIHLNHNNNNNNNNSINTSLGKVANVNSKTRGNSCNLGPTTGANVIKQKISLLRRVCKHTAKKRSPTNCGSPTSPCTDHPFYFDSNHPTKPVNV